MAGNYYKILGLDKTADEKEIKRAYRKLAKKYHPDTNPGNAEAEKRFKEVNEAYDVLGDSKKKALYDKYGEIGLQEGFDPKAYEAYQRGGYAGPGHGADFSQFHFEGDLNDLFSDLFSGKNTGGFSGGFHRSGFYDGAGFGRKQAAARGSDLTAQISISFEEAAMGCDKTITLSDPNGTRSSLQVHIPAGIDEGQKVRLKGKGAPGVQGAHSGDLLLEVHILPKSGFERKGQDIYVTVNIPFTTAALGGEAIVPTLNGKVACRIKAGTQSGSRIRLKGKGIVSMKDPASFGDEYVVVQIEVPKTLSPEQRKALEAYAALTGGQSGSSKGRAA